MGISTLRTRAVATPQPQSGNVVRFVASTDSVDRHGSRVMPRGMDATAYLQNPIFLWNHNSGDACKPEDILGRVIRLAVEAVNGRDAVVADVEFATHDAEGNPRPRAVECLALVRAGLLNAVSIGFVPRKVDAVDGVEVVSRWELVELSLVPVPSNSEALAMRVLRSAPFSFRGKRSMNPEIMNKLGVSATDDSAALVAALTKYLCSTTDGPEDRQAVADAVKGVVDAAPDAASAPAAEKAAPEGEPDGDEMVKALTRAVGELKALQVRVAALETRAVTPASVAAPVAKRSLSERLFGGAGNPAPKVTTKAAPNFGNQPGSAAKGIMARVDAQLAGRTE